MSQYDIPPVPDDHSIPPGAKCQEASPFSVNGYVPCSAPATSIVYSTRDARSYYVCSACAWHDVENRNMQLLFSRADPQEQAEIGEALDNLVDVIRRPFTPKPPSRPKPRGRGKYGAFVNDLPRFPGDDPDRRQVVEAVKQSILEPLNDKETLGDSEEVHDRLNDMQLIVDRLIYVEKRATAGRPWASEFARVYAELRAIRKKIDEWDKSIGLLTEAYVELMTAQMEVEGITSMKLANGQPISTYLEPWATVRDKETFRLWCIEQGLERQMHLHPRTTNSMTKEMLLAGESEPPGVVVYAKMAVRLGKE